MQRRTTAKFLEVLIKPTRVIPFNSFHSSATRLGCSIKSAEQTVSDIKHEHAKTVKAHLNEIQQLKINLSECRSLLSHLFENSNKDFLDHSIFDRTTHQINEFKLHRIKDHSLLTKHLEDKLQDAQSKINALNEQEEKIHETLDTYQEKAHKELVQLVSERYAIYEKGITIKADLDKLEEINPGSEQSSQEIEEQASIFKKHF